MISPKQRIVYNFILQYKLAHDGCAPTIREIMRGCGYKTTSAVYYVLGRLASDGAIEIDAKNSRSIRIVGAEWLPPPSEQRQPRVTNRQMVSAMALLNQSAAAEQSGG